MSSSRIKTRVHMLHDNDKAAAILAKERLDAMTKERKALHQRYGRKGKVRVIDVVGMDAKSTLDRNIEGVTGPSILDPLRAHNAWTRHQIRDLCERHDL